MVNTVLNLEVTGSYPTMLSDHSYAFLDGKISIQSNGLQVLNWTEVLLVELGFYIKNWLKDGRANGFGNFQYLSIEDEDFIFSFNKIENDKYLFVSNNLFDKQGFMCDENEIISTFSEYLEKLSIILEKRYGINLARLYEAYLLKLVKSSRY